MTPPRRRSWPRARTTIRPARLAGACPGPRRLAGGALRHFRTAYAGSPMIAIPYSAWATRSAWLATPPRRSPTSKRRSATTFSTGYRARGQLGRPQGPAVARPVRRRLRGPAPPPEARAWFELAIARNPFDTEGRRPWPASNRTRDGPGIRLEDNGCRERPPRAGATGLIRSGPAADPRIGAAHAARKKPLGWPCPLDWDSSSGRTAVLSSIAWKGGAGGPWDEPGPCRAGRRSPARSLLPVPGGSEPLDLDLLLDQFRRDAQPGQDRSIKWSYNPGSREPVSPFLKAIS